MSLLNYSESLTSWLDQDLFWRQPSPQLQPFESMNPEPPISGSGRACQRCIVKKVKCNRHRPSCSRCAEVETPCVYSSSKRKPGPAKGSRRKRPNISLDDPSSDSQSQLSPTTTNGTLQNLRQPPVSLEDLVSRQALPRPSTLLNNTPPSSIIINSIDHGNVEEFPVYPQLPAAQERHLLEDFFTYIHPSIPLFNKSRFLERYKQGRVTRELLQTLLTVSARILGAAAIVSNRSQIECMAFLLSGNPISEEDSCDNFSLSKFQQACLLAFYEFHQLPSKKSWQKIGELARKAYQCDLHQVDNPDCRFLNANGSVPEEDIDEWRNVWWCIYCLDSYCNITAVTPFVVELESIRTALTVIFPPECGRTKGADAVFLPAETGLLWKTTKYIFSCPGDPNPIIHLITTTLLKEAGLLLRLWKQNPSERLKPRFSILEDHISTVRLALPSRYLDVARNVRDNEQNAEHHARLICILHLHAARLLVSQPIQEPANGAEWLRRWHGILEHCEEVVSVVRQWKTQNCLSVDPAICFIISGVLITLHLISKDGTIVNPELQSRLLTQKHLLCLFLEQFASIWQLPRFLLASFQNFSKKFSGPLTTADIDQILRQNLGLLHQGWFKLISMTPNDLQPPATHGVDRAVLSEGDFNDWELWANGSNISFPA